MTRSSATPAASRSSRAGARWVGSAFGLRLEADLPVFGLDRGDCALEPQTRLRRALVDEIDAAWPATEAERLVDRRRSDGSVVMTVDMHPVHGYRIDAPAHGRFRVAVDGSLIECAPAHGPAWRWHRPFFAQALPLAAALSGMEVLHASAVVLDGAAIAFSGHSGAGKTSLAIHLLDQGAALLADDVVALSAIEGRLHAHPGVRLANVAEEQLEDIDSARRPRLGRTIGRSDKLHLLIEPVADDSAPLGALYFINRRGEVDELDFERLDPPDPRWLLAATFMPHITAPPRMRAQLEACALIATAVPTFQLHVPPTLEAAALAPAVIEHARQLDRSS
jgi:hypothetical protein